MREEGRHYFVVGAFVVAMSAGLVLWLAVLAGRTGATDSYSVVYDKVMGLSAGTQVLYQGYVIGVVESIEPEMAGTAAGFRVHLAVQRDWPIPEDSEAVITSPGFLSAVVIDVRGGRSRTYLEPGSEIRAGVSADLRAAVSSAAAGVRELEDRIAPLLDSLADGTPEILANLRDFSADLSQAGERIGEVLSPENVGRVEVILANLEQASANVSRLGSDLRETRGELDRLLSRANALLREDGDLDHAVRDLHMSLDAIANHSEVIAQDLEITSRNLAEFSRQIRANPSLLLRGRGDAPEPD